MQAAALRANRFNFYRLRRRTLASRRSCVAICAQSEFEDGSMIVPLETVGRRVVHQPQGRAQGKSQESAPEYGVISAITLVESSCGSAAGSTAAGPIWNSTNPQGLDRLVCNVDPSQKALRRSRHPRMTVILVPENSMCLLAALPPSPPHTRSAASARLRR
jgi:hypothetical protein